MDLIKIMMRVTAHSGRVSPRTENKDIVNLLCYCTHVWTRSISFSCQGTNGRLTGIFRTNFHESASSDARLKGCKMLQKPHQNVVLQMTRRLRIREKRSYLAVFILSGGQTKAFQEASVSCLFDHLLTAESADPAWHREASPHPARRGTPRLWGRPPVSSWRTRHLPFQHQRGASLAFWPRRHPGTPGIVWPASGRTRTQTRPADWGAPRIWSPAGWNRSNKWIISEWFNASAENPKCRPFDRRQRSDLQMSSKLVSSRLFKKRILLRCLN